MITINLLPQELRHETKTTRQIPAKKVAIAAGAVFILLTLFFDIDLLLSHSKLRSLEKKWIELQPGSDGLKRLQSEVDSQLKPEKEFMDKYVTSPKPMTFILIWLSEFLPETTWLTEVTMERKGEGCDLLLRGLALPSKEKSSIEHIEEYLNHLQEKIPESKLSLTTTRQEIEQVELTQFTAHFTWGIKTP